MHMLKRAGLLLLAALSTSVLLSGCGGGSSSSNTIPSVVTIFDAHNAIFRNATSSTLLTAGYNGFGQLGLDDGNLTTDRPTFQVVPALAQVQVKGVATGAVHTVAFGNVSSIVYAWGSNFRGQLGNGTTTSGTGAYSQSPVRVGPVTNLDGTTTPLTGVTAVAAGSFHSLAVTNGQVVAWGYGGYGQLGQGQNPGLVIDFSDKVAPVVVKNEDGSGPLSGITSVAAGGGHSLALTNDGRVYAWGHNDYGQLGVNSTSPNAQYLPLPTPVQIGLTPLQNIKAIAAAGSYSLALSSDGQTLYFWGINIGSPASGLHVDTPTPVSLIPGPPNPPTPIVDATHPILKISAGLDHFLILVDDGSHVTGTVYAIGFNGYNQLDLDSASTTTTPTDRVVTFTLASGVTTFSSSHDSNFVQITMNPGRNPNADPQIPAIVLTGVSDIRAFGNSSLAFVSDASTGRYGWYGWGDNGHGQLGNPISTTSIGYLGVPTKVQGQGL